MFRRNYKGVIPTACLLASLAFGPGCSDDSATSDSGTPGADGGQQDRGQPLFEQGAPDQGGATQLPPVPVQSGVAYVANFDSTELFFYRTDGQYPSAAGSLELGAATHNLALDPYNDLLYVVADAPGTVTIFQLSRPAGPDQPLTPPAQLGIISDLELPMFARVNPQRQRLYVVTSPDGTPPFEEFWLRAYDVANPAAPQELAGSPFTIPATASLALDSAREALFVLGLLTDKIHVFDLRGDQLVALPGEPFDLRAAYPEEHQTGFAAHGLTVDIYRHRLYGARSQSILSELIVLEYPEALPDSSQGYAQLAAHSDLQVLADPFDVTLDMEQRPTIYNAHIPAVDLQRGHVLLSAAGWFEMTTPGIFVAISKDLTLGSGCNQLDGFGCWFQLHSGATPTPVPTGGAACVDYTHQVAVGTSIDPGRDNLPGYVHMFRYQDDLAMQPWLTQDGADLSAGSRPITAVCH